MKLLKYNVGDNLFILLENTNILIKKKRNIYNVFINNELKFSYNKTYLLRFIQKSYKEYYDELNILLNQQNNNNFKGGSIIANLTENAGNIVSNTLNTTNNAPAQENPENPENQENPDKTNTTSVEPIVTKKVNTEVTDDLSMKMKKTIDKYSLVFKLLIILGKIIPTEINISKYVNKIYKEIIENNEDYVITEQYILNRLNKNISKSKNICTMVDQDIKLSKYIPKKDTIVTNNLNKLIDNSILLEKIKQNIDSEDVKNNNDIHFHYKFDIKEGSSIMWDGNIDEYLDKIFGSTKLTGHLLNIHNMIAQNINNDFEKSTEKLLSQDEWAISKNIDSFNKEYFENLDKLIKSDKDYENYNIKVKYNPLSKDFEVFIKITKTKMDEYFNKNANKLVQDEDNIKEINKYMDDLSKSLLKMLNSFIKYVIGDYIDGLGSEKTGYFEATFGSDKTALKYKIENIKFNFLNSTNLSMYNFQEIQVENDELLKELLDSTINKAQAIKNIDDINNIINIKYSQCNDIEINKCIQNNVSTGNLVCELVKYRDTKKLPISFLEDFEYKRGLNTTEPGMLWGTNDKAIEIGLIIKNITEKIYIKTKELNLKLSEVFVNSIIKNIKKNLKKTLYTFKFDIAYSTDYLKEQTQVLETLISELDDIIMETKNNITYENIIKADDNFYKFNNTMKKEDDSWTLFRDNTYSKEQVNMKVEFLNKIIKYTIKLNHIDIIKNNLLWSLNSQILIYHLFEFINTESFKNYSSNTDNALGYKIIEEIRNIIKTKNEFFKPIINTSQIENNDIVISILDNVDPRKIAKSKIAKTDDSQFISTGLVGDTDDKFFKKLDELEKFIFKSRILKETREEFIDSIMFLYKKKQDSHWELEIDNDKRKFYKIYVSKVSRRVRAHFKDELEKEFSNLNSEHDKKLNELGLKDKDLKSLNELDSSKLDDEITKLNTEKFNLYQSKKQKVDDILKLINSETKGTTLFKYIIDKYVISNRKLPVDFSAEYEKVKIEYEENLQSLLYFFSKTTNELSLETSNKINKVKNDKSKNDEVKNDEVKNESKSDMISSSLGNIPTDVLKTAENAIPATLNAVNTLKDMNVPGTMKTVENIGNIANIANNVIENSSKLANTKITGGNKQEDLEEFIKKIVNVTGEHTNPKNINVAISKLQLMYIIKDKQYTQLIELYAKLNDSYNKLIKLEKVNRLPITSRPAILILIDKLFIDNLSGKHVSVEKDEDDDDTNNVSSEDDDDEDDDEIIRNKKDTKDAKKDEKKITGEISKLFNSNLDVNENVDLEKNEAVVIDIKTGQVIS